MWSAAIQWLQLVKYLRRERWTFSHAELHRPDLLRGGVMIAPFINVHVTETGSSHHSTA